MQDKIERYKTKKTEMNKRLFDLTIESKDQQKQIEGQREHMETAKRVIEEMNLSVKEYRARISDLEEKLSCKIN